MTVTRQFIRFPGFLDKAVSLSYDDGSTWDFKMKEILDRYGMRCTLNLCSGWITEDGDEKRKRLSKSDIQKFLDDGKYELACHGVNHVSLSGLTEEQGVGDMINDRLAMEKTFGRIVKGMAYANGSIGGQSTEIVRVCGFEYARTTVNSEKFDLPKDWLNLAPTVHHTNPKLMQLADEFLTPFAPNHYYWAIAPKWFLLWGHSYEFGEQDNWDVLEAFCRKVGLRDDVWYATVGEMCAYVNAYDALRFSADGSLVHNPTSTDLYLNVYRENVKVPAGATVPLTVKQLY